MRTSFFRTLQQRHQVEVVRNGTVYGTDEETLQVQLDFLKKEKKKRAVFLLNETMVNILKSDLKANRAATIVKSGISFKKLAKLIRRGSDMNMMNRLVETKETIHIYFFGIFYIFFYIFLHFFTFF